MEPRCELCTPKGYKDDVGCNTKLSKRIDPLDERNSFITTFCSLTQQTGGSRIKISCAAADKEAEKMIKVAKQDSANG